MITLLDTVEWMLYTKDALVARLWLDNLHKVKNTTLN